MIWIGSSREDLKAFPVEVKHEIGYALLVAQHGKKHDNVKPYTELSGVMEIVSDYDKEAYRAIYAYKIGEVIYVLHAFHKKSKKGKKIPKEIKETINLRYKRAKEYEKTRRKN